MVYALAGLLVLQLLGEALAQWLSLPLPGPLIGMLLLFAYLIQRGGVPAAMQECANGLLRALMLLFIPAVTGVMLYFERVGQEWLAIFAASIGGAAVTMAVTAFTLRLMLRLTGGRNHEGRDVRDLGLPGGLAAAVVDLDGARVPRRLRLYQRSGFNPVVNPVLIAVVVIIGVLLATGRRTRLTSKARSSFTS